MTFEETFVLDLLEQFPGFASELHEPLEVRCHLFGEPFLIDQLKLDLLPRLFVKLVHGGADRLELALLAARELDHGVQELPVIDFDLE